MNQSITSIILGLSLSACSTPQQQTLPEDAKPKAAFDYSKGFMPAVSKSELPKTPCLVQRLQDSVKAGENYISRQDLFGEKCHVSKEEQQLEPHVKTVLSSYSNATALHGYHIFLQDLSDYLSSEKTKRVVRDHAPAIEFQVYQTKITEAQDRLSQMREDLKEVNRVYSSFIASVGTQEPTREQLVTVKQTLDAYIKKADTDKSTGITLANCFDYAWNLLDAQAGDQDLKKMVADARQTKIIQLTHARSIDLREEVESYFGPDTVELPMLLPVPTIPQPPITPEEMYR
ncbi:hypothetical protein HYV86_02835 [Candidatus Woesearchaeota archaeon]|nr:hypothetical protein [Candidatus Woesearchaeota archaeon]